MVLNVFLGTITTTSLFFTCNCLLFLEQRYRPHKNTAGQARDALANELIGQCFQILKVKRWPITGTYKTKLVHALAITPRNTVRIVDNCYVTEMLLS